MHIRRTVSNGSMSSLLKDQKQVVPVDSKVIDSGSDSEEAAEYFEQAMRLYHKNKALFDKYGQLNKKLLEGGDTTIQSQIDKLLLEQITPVYVRIITLLGEANNYVAAERIVNEMLLSGKKPLAERSFEFFPEDFMKAYNAYRCAFDPKMRKIFESVACKELLKAKQQKKQGMIDSEVDIYDEAENMLCDAGVNSHIAKEIIDSAYDKVEKAYKSMRKEKSRDVVLAQKFSMMFVHKKIPLPEPKKATVAISERDVLSPKHDVPSPTSESSPSAGRKR